MDCLEGSMRRGQKYQIFVQQHVFFSDFFLSMHKQCNCIILGFYDKFKIFVGLYFMMQYNGWLRYEMTNNNCTTFDTMRSVLFQHWLLIGAYLLSPLPQGVGI
mgnify:CR=1 FL=1